LIMFFRTENGFGNVNGINGAFGGFGNAPASNGNGSYGGAAPLRNSLSSSSFGGAGMLGNSVSTTFGAGAFGGGGGAFGQTQQSVPPIFGNSFGNPSTTFGNGTSAAAGNGFGNGNSGQSQRNEKACVVCLTNDKQVRLDPCGHICLCTECAQLITKECPLCQAPITRQQIVSSVPSALIFGGQIFGNSSTASSTNTNPFANFANPSTTASSNGAFSGNFGNVPASATTSNPFGNFGNIQAPTFAFGPTETTNSFGSNSGNAPPNPFEKKNSPPFPQTASASNLDNPFQFGSQPYNANNVSGTGFQSSFAPASIGTAHKRYASLALEDSEQRFITITRAEEYKNKSLEELRWEDLSGHAAVQGNRAPQPQETKNSGFNSAPAFNFSNAGTGASLNAPPAKASGFEGLGFGAPITSNNTFQGVNPFDAFKSNAPAAVGSSASSFPPKAVPGQGFGSNSRLPPNQPRPQPMPPNQPRPIVDASAPKIAAVDSDPYALSSLSETSFMSLRHPSFGSLTFTPPSVATIARTCSRRSIGSHSLTYRPPPTPTARKTCFGLISAENMHAGLEAQMLKVNTFTSEDPQSGRVRLTDAAIGEASIVGLPEALTGQL
jgi:hypothetical protein